MLEQSFSNVKNGNCTRHVRKEFVLILPTDAKDGIVRNPRLSLFQQEQFTVDNQPNPEGKLTVSLLGT